MEYVIELLIKTCIDTFYITGIIILIGLLIGMLRNYSMRNFQKSFGSKAVMITGFIGVPIHELSHAIAAILFRHKITDIKLFQKPDENGVMGYVNHSYNRHSIYQQVGNFFIGIAPMFGGVICIVTLMYFMVPQCYNNFTQILTIDFHMTVLDKSTIYMILSSYKELIKSIFLLENFKDLSFYVFLFASICISSHMSLSSADIKGASRGLGVIFVILLLLNVFDLVKYISDTEIIRFNILITGVLIVAIILSFITAIVSKILLVITTKK